MKALAAARPLPPVTRAILPCNEMSMECPGVGAQWQSPSRGRRMSELAHAAVDDDLAADDEGRFRCGQVQDGRSQFLRRAEAAQRHLRLDLRGSGFQRG